MIAKTIKAPEAFIPPKTLVDIEPNNDEYVVLSDLHLPYQLESVIDEIKKEHSGKTLIINGDFVDAYSISTFSKRSVTTLIDEIRYANQYIKDLSKYFSEVILLDGNHERRLYRYIESKAEELGFFHPDSVNYYVSRRLSFGLDYLQVGESLPGVTYYDSRFLKIGDVIFTHPSDSLRSVGGVAKRVIEAAISEGIDFKYAIIGHTHRVGLTQHLGKLCYETGCLTYENRYITRPNKMRQPQQHGYCVISFERNIAKRIELCVITLEG